MRRVGFGLRGLVLAIFCLAPLGSALAQTPGSSSSAPPSSVQIFMPNGGMPTRALLMTLASDEGRTETVFTDSKGIYAMRTPTARAVNYTVTIKGDDQTFETTALIFRIEKNSPGRFLVFLKPIASAKLPVNGVVDASTLESNVPSKAHAAYQRAMVSIGKGELESAIGSLQEAIRLYPEYVRARNDLGVVFMKLNRLDEAAATFRQASDINKRFFHPRMNLGIVLTKQGKYKEALDVLEPLYEENHGMLEVRLAYARALEGAGQLSDAEKIYRSTLESKNLPPETQADMHFCLGVLLNRQRKFGDAVTELQKAIALNDAANSHLQLGAALMLLQQPSAAEHELLRAYELGGQSAGAAQLLLGNIYYAQQRFSDAQRALEQFLKDVPSAPNAPQITRVIADLKTRSKN
jgi:tetratricopeptide (TPR) repeat protein